MSDWFPFICAADAWAEANAANDWADEKAEEVATHCVHSGETHVMYKSVQARYAQALREARAKGIEEAAEFCAGPVIIEEGVARGHDRDWLAGQIRKLKEKP